MKPVATRELHRHPYAVRFHDVDLAGIVFFANYFRIAHEAYEAWLESIGLPLSLFVDGVRAGLPIASAEADYRSSIRLAARLQIAVHLEKCGRTSFILQHHFLGSSEECHAILRTVHVHIDPMTKKPTPLPDSLARALSR